MGSVLGGQPHFGGKINLSEICGSYERESKDDSSGTAARARDEDGSAGEPSSIRPRARLSGAWEKGREGRSGRGTFDGFYARLLRRAHDFLRRGQLSTHRAG